MVTDLINVRYLTGLHSSNAALLLASDSVLVTDDRYATAASQACPELRLISDRDVVAGAVRVAAELGFREVGFDAHAMNVATFTACEALGIELGVRLVAVDDPVAAARACKDEAEIQMLREACSISERALARLLPAIAVGETELSVAARLDILMREEGAEANAFETIVASGPASAEPHHQPTDRAIGRGDFVVIDCGARWQGYHADMTRTVIVGAEPADWQLEIYGVVSEAAAIGRHALRPGVELRAVDTASRSHIQSAGFGEWFQHGLGHGVGLEIHEAPMLGPRSPAGTLAEHMTVTVEPGIYLPGRGGVRIEDSLVVTSAGAESLTTMTRELLVLG